MPERTENSREKSCEAFGKNPVFYVSVETKEQLEAVLEEKDIQGVYCHISMFDKKAALERGF